MMREEEEEEAWCLPSLHHMVPFLCVMAGEVKECEGGGAGKEGREFEERQKWKRKEKGGKAGKKKKKKLCIFKHSHFTISK